MNERLQLQRNIEISRMVIAGTPFRTVGKEYDLTYTRIQQIFRDTLERALKFNTNKVQRTQDEWEYMFTKRVRARAIHWNVLLRKLSESINS